MKHLMVFITALFVASSAQAEDTYEDRVYTSEEHAEATAKLETAERILNVMEAHIAKLLVKVRNQHDLVNQYKTELTELEEELGSTEEQLSTLIITRVATTGGQSGVRLYLYSELYDATAQISGRLSSNGWSFGNFRGDHNWVNVYDNNAFREEIIRISTINGLESHSGWAGFFRNLDEISI